MSSLPGAPLRLVPTGVADTLDNANSSPGRCTALTNIIPDPSTDGVWQCRPAAIVIMDFVSFDTPTVVSAGIQLGTRVYGLIGSARNPGCDEPFVYDIASGAFLTVDGIAADNVPFTQPFTGDWTPPTADVIGSRIVFTHPGFAGTANFYGWFDTSGFDSTTLLGGTTSGSDILKPISDDPLTAGVTIGMKISGAGIPANSVVTAVSDTSITISNNATATSTQALTGTVTAGSTVVNFVSPDPLSSGVVVGSTVTGTGIPANTTVTAVTDSSITLSAPATAGAAISVAGTATSASNVLSAVTPNPITAGVTVGMAITGTVIPANTTVVGVTSTTITMSNNATASVSVNAQCSATSYTSSMVAQKGVALTILGGTPAEPLWVAGNAQTNPLPKVPTNVAQFNNRAYLAIDNQLWFTDVLNPTNIENATDFLVLGDSEPITALSSVGLLTTIGGIVQSLLPFKTTSIWQINGDSALQDLDLNVLSGAVGTRSPRSVVNVPEGVVFRADDGIRMVSLTGTVTEYLDDIRNPFIYATTPSRISAVFQMGTYRICCQPDYLENQAHQEFWYDFKKQVWSGPHTFQHDLALPYLNTTVLFSNAIPRTMFQSDLVIGPTSSFIENNSSLTYEVLTAPQTFGADPGMQSIVLSTVDIALGSSTSLFAASQWGAFNWGAALWLGMTNIVVSPQATCLGFDEDESVIGQGTIAAQEEGVLWGGFNWGGAVWGNNGGADKLKQHIIAWNQPLVFDKLQVQLTGISGSGVKVGSFRAFVEQQDYPTFL